VSTSVAPVATRRVERRLAPLWMASLRTPEVASALDRLGLSADKRYFPPRAAPLGAASLPLVVATFFNFSPVAVGRAIPAVWDTATPEQVLAAQLAGVDVALRRAFAPLDGAVVGEALALLRAAAEAACERPEGRPLFAGYASLPWPDEPHLALWHAHYLLREFRGDGHIAVLVAEGLTGIDALAIHVAQLPAIGAIFRQSRAWTDAEWALAIDGLRSEGWLTGVDELALTTEGARRREAIETRTDELNVPAYAPIGDAGCERLMELARPIGQALADAGLGMTLPPR
jgi:Helix-turn-helix family